ncbi:MAG: ABC transporter permease [Tissierellia bacterium]|nr:ABC transporter permease [Bacillota bacterium]NLK58096.1 ABC transporter permease [Tissierellia bacterium]
MNKWLKRLFVFCVLAFLYAPILVLIVYSFNASRLRGSWDGFTLGWYQALFRDREVLRALYHTVLVAVLATVISTVVGTLASFGIHSLGRRGKSVILNLNYLPVLNPDIVTAVSLMLLFGFMGLNFGFGTLLMGHISFTVPYVVLSVLPKLGQMDPNLYEAALDLGAEPGTALRKVVLPEISPGIVTGALLAFTLSIDDFVISFFTTGHGVANLSTMIFSMARRGINPVINALSTLIFIVMIALLLVINRKTKEEV